VSGVLSEIKELTKYRSAMVGLFIIAIFVAVAIYAVV